MAKKKRTKKRNPSTKTIRKKIAALKKSLTKTLKRKKKNPARRKRSNPLPIGKAVRVKAVRRPDGKIDLYR